MNIDTASGWIMNVKTTALFGLWVVIAGCSGGVLAPAQTPQGVRFEVPRESYTADDSIELLLSNETDSVLLYNLCFAALERRQGGSWHEVDRSRPDHVCTADLASLEPTESVTVNQDVEPWMDVGVYRFRTVVEISQEGPNEQAILISSEFRIMR